MIYRLTCGENIEIFELNESYRHTIDSPKFKLRDRIERFRYKLPQVPFGTIQKAVIKFDKQKVVDGELKWVSAGSETVLLPQERCDQNSYELEMDKILNVLPLSLQNFVRSQAYERGHSSGYEECLNIAKGLTYELEQLLPQLKRELV